MDKISYLLCIVLVILQYSLWLGKNGICDFFYIYNSNKLYRNNNDIMKIKIRNDQLLLEIHDLRYGYESIEEHARYDLGMIKSDEILYQDTM